MSNKLTNAFILLMLSLFMSTALLAQEDEGYEGDDDELMEEGFNIPDQGFNLKQRIFVGGGIGLIGFSSQQIGINVSPFVGVRVIDQIHLGVGFNYGYQSRKVPIAPGLTQTRTERISLYGYKIFGKFLFLNTNALFSGTTREPGDPLGGIYALTEFAGTEYRASIDGQPAELIPPPLGYEFLLGLGYQANFYRGFDYFFEGTYDLLDRNTNTFPVGIRTGLYYGF